MTWLAPLKIMQPTDLVRRRLVCSFPIDKKHPGCQLKFLLEPLLCCHVFCFLMLGASLCLMITCEEDDVDQQCGLVSPCVVVVMLLSILIGHFVTSTLVRIVGGSILIFPLISPGLQGSLVVFLQWKLASRLIRSCKIIVVCLCEFLSFVLLCGFGRPWWSIVCRSVNPTRPSHQPITVHCAVHCSA